MKSSVSVLFVCLFVSVSNVHLLCFFWFPHISEILWYLSFSVLETGGGIVKYPSESEGTWRLKNKASHFIVFTQCFIQGKLTDMEARQGMTHSNYMAVQPWLHGYMATHPYPLPSLDIGISPGG